jgi:ABC-type transport system involved in multi-copper enzyme maturation permease subunit
MRTAANMTRNELTLAFHNRMIFLFVLFSVFAVPLMHLFNFFTMGQEMKIIKDFTFSIINIMGIILAVFYPIYSVKEDLERKYIYNILSKPVPRISYIIGKYCGICAVITLITCFNFAVLYVFLILKGEFLPLAYAGALFLLMTKFYLLAIISLFFGLLPFSVYLGSILSVFLFIAGNIKNYALTAMSYTTEKTLSFYFSPLLKILPDFQVFDVYDSLIGGDVYSAQIFFKAVGYFACYALAFVIFSFVALRKKEI